MTLVANSSVYFATQCLFRHTLYTIVVSSRRLSVTFTALVWTGITLILVGAIMTFFSIGSDVTAFKVTIFDVVELRTSHIGLVLIIVGAVLSGIVSLRLPADVRIFGESKRSLTERIAENALIPSVILIILALLVLLVLVFL